MTAHPNGSARSRPRSASTICPRATTSSSCGPEDLIASTGFQIGRILKPAYRARGHDRSPGLCRGRPDPDHGPRHLLRGNAGPGRHAPDRWRRRAQIHDRRDRDRHAADHRATSASDYDDQDVDDVGPVTVTPARAEEGEIAGASREILVFPSSWTIDGDRRRCGRTGTRQGRPARRRSRSARARDRAAAHDPWGLDPAGAPVAGATVTAHVHRVHPTTARRAAPATTSSRRRSSRSTTTHPPNAMPTRSRSDRQQGSIHRLDPGVGRAPYRFARGHGPDGSHRPLDGWPIEDGQRVQADGGALRPDRGDRTPKARSGSATRST